MAASCGNHRHISYFVWICKRVKEESGSYRETEATGHKDLMGGLAHVITEIPHLQTGDPGEPGVSFKVSPKA